MLKTDPTYQQQLLLASSRALRELPRKDPQMRNFLLRLKRQLVDRDNVSVLAGTAAPSLSLPGRFGVAAAPETAPAYVPPPDLQLADVLARPEIALPLVDVYTTAMAATQEVLELAAAAVAASGADAAAQGNWPFPLLMQDRPRAAILKDAALWNGEVFTPRASLPQGLGDGLQAKVDTLTGVTKVAEALVASVPDQTAAAAMGLTIGGVRNAVAHLVEKPDDDKVLQNLRNRLAAAKRSLVASAPHVKDAEHALARIDNAAAALFAAASDPLRQRASQQALDAYGLVVPGQGSVMEAVLDGDTAAKTVPFPTPQWVWTCLEPVKTFIAQKDRSRIATWLEAAAGLKPQQLPLLLDGDTMAAVAKVLLKLLRVQPFIPLEAATSTASLHTAVKALRAVSDTEVTGEWTRLRQDLLVLAEFFLPTAGPAERRGAAGLRGHADLTLPWPTWSAHTWTLREMVTQTPHGSSNVDPELADRFSEWAFGACPAARWCNAAAARCTWTAAGLGGGILLSLMDRGTRQASQAASQLSLTALARITRENLQYSLALVGVGLLPLATAPLLGLDGMFALETTTAAAVVSDDDDDDAEAKPAALPAELMPVIAGCARAAGVYECLRCALALPEDIAAMHAGMDATRRGAGRARLDDHRHDMPPVLALLRPLLWVHSPTWSLQPIAMEPATLFADLPLLAAAWPTWWKQAILQTIEVHSPEALHTPAVRIGLQLVERFVMRVRGKRETPSRAAAFSMDETATFLAQEPGLFTPQAALPATAAGIGSFAMDAFRGVALVSARDQWLAERAGVPLESLTSTAQRPKARASISASAMHVAAFRELVREQRAALRTKGGEYAALQEPYAIVDFLLQQVQARAASLAAAMKQVSIPELSGLEPAVLMLHGLYLPPDSANSTGFKAWYQKARAEQPAAAIKDDNEAAVEGLTLLEQALIEPPPSLEAAAQTRASMRTLFELLALCLNNPQAESDMLQFLAWMRNPSQQVPQRYEKQKTALQMWRRVLVPQAPQGLVFQRLEEFVPAGAEIFAKRFLDMSLGMAVVAMEAWDRVSAAAAQIRGVARGTAATDDDDDEANDPFAEAVKELGAQNDSLAFSSPAAAAEALQDAGHRLLRATSASLCVLLALLQRLAPEALQDDGLGSAAAAAPVIVPLNTASFDALNPLRSPVWGSVGSEGNDEDTNSVAGDVDEVETVPADNLPVVTTAGEGSSVVEGAEGNAGEEAVQQGASSPSDNIEDMDDLSKFFSLTAGGGDNWTLMLNANSAAMTFLGFLSSPEGLAHAVSHFCAKVTRPVWPELVASMWPNGMLQAPISDESDGSDDEFDAMVAMCGVLRLNEVAKEPFSVVLDIFLGNIPDKDNEEALTAIAGIAGYLLMQMAFEDIMVSRDYHVHPKSLAATAIRVAGDEGLAGWEPLPLFTAAAWGGGHMDGAFEANAETVTPDFWNDVLLAKSSQTLRSVLHHHIGRKLHRAMKGLVDVQDKLAFLVPKQDLKQPGAFPWTSPWTGNVALDRTWLLDSLPPTTEALPPAWRLPELTTQRLGRMRAWIRDRFAAPEGKGSDGDNDKDGDHHDELLQDLEGLEHYGLTAESGFTRFWAAQCLACFGMLQELELKLKVWRATPQLRRPGDDDDTAVSLDGPTTLFNDVLVKVPMVLVNIAFDGVRFLRSANWAKLHKSCCCVAGGSC